VRVRAVYMEEWRMKCLCQERRKSSGYWTKPGKQL